MQSLKSIQYQGKLINFSFNNGALSFMREAGYVIDLKSNPLENLACPIDEFLADFLLCSARFYSRKDTTFDYDRNDAFDWMDIMGGLQPVAEIFGDTLRGGIKIPDELTPPKTDNKKK
jgi:hypothetical protein